MNDEAKYLEGLTPEQEQENHPNAKQFDLCPTCGGTENYSKGEGGVCSNAWHFYDWESDQVDPDLNTQIEQIVWSLWDEGYKAAVHDRKPKGLRPPNIGLPTEATAQLQQLVDDEAQKRVEAFADTFPNPAYSEEYVQAEQVKIIKGLKQALHDHDDKILKAAGVSKSHPDLYVFDEVIDNYIKELEQSRSND